MYSSHAQFHSHQLRSVSGSTSYQDQETHLTGNNEPQCPKKHKYGITAHWIHQQTICSPAPLYRNSSRHTVSKWSAALKLLAEAATRAFQIWIGNQHYNHECRLRQKTFTPHKSRKCFICWPCPRCRCRSVKLWVRTSVVFFFLKSLGSSINALI